MTTTNYSPDHRERETTTSIAPSSSSLRTQLTGAVVTLIDGDPTHKAEWCPDKPELRSVEALIHATFVKFYGRCVAGDIEREGAGVYRADGVAVLVLVRMARVETPRRVMDRDARRKPNLPYSYNGESLTLRQWASRLGVKRETLYERIYRHGWAVEDALTVPIGGPGKNHFRKVAA